MPRLGLALTKKAVNQAEDLMGLQSGIDSVFGLHHVAHAYNAEVGSDHLGGHDAQHARRGALVAAPAARPARWPTARGRRAGELVLRLLLLLRAIPSSRIERYCSAIASAPSAPPGLYQRATVPSVARMKR